MTSDKRPSDLKLSFEDHERALDLVRETLARERLLVDPLTLASFIILSFVENGLKLESIPLNERILFTRGSIIPAIDRLSRIVRSLADSAEQPNLETLN